MNNNELYDLREHIEELEKKVEELERVVENLSEKMVEHVHSASAFDFLNTGKPIF
jgi:archaellum component FlaC